MDGVVDYFFGGVVIDPYVFVDIFNGTDIRIGVVEDVLFVGFFLILL